MSEKEKAALEKIARAFPKMSDYHKAKLEGYCERIEEEQQKDAEKDDTAEPAST